MKKSVRLLAMLLCVLSIVALLPTVAFAAEPEDLGTVKVALAKVTESVKNAKIQANITRRVTVYVGYKYTITCKASISGCKYQWQLKKGSSGSWKNIKGATKTKYNFTATKGKNGWRYRCRVSKAGYRTAYGDTWVLKVRN